MGSFLFQKRISLIGLLTHTVTVTYSNLILVDLEQPIRRKLVINLSSWKQI
jgi:hypothetical protein